MADTKQTKAIAAANGIIGIAQQLSSLRSTINAFVAPYNSEGYSTVWNNLATAALNADGSLGTADASPNTSHPIDTRVAANQGLLKAVSATQLVNAVAMIEQLQNFFGNLAVTQNNYNVTVDDLAN